MNKVRVIAVKSRTSDVQLRSVHQRILLVKYSHIFVFLYGFYSCCEQEIIYLSVLNSSHKKASVITKLFF